ncbi:CitMHS family citrate-Mg2+:H+ or citrate-Ca2+:H+ symporter [Nocardioides luteus]|uniref:Citrate transporter n=1 Tax=Nocardioides luteus TaxID=1844 RepID=A0ABQ5SUH4_9ACTN|nr:citrate:proton symporter [Nocardioides luteus]MDR7309209.1 CitMHS family citrate-Mg2+:H+ or citrate-Ca2+:H+ symporter [Nocardioides luteus]GGR49072.1 citrate transporter [Nocardioides luteus]GLJ67614.1 citrate transporter [Nocardioides luteus]
MLSLMGFVTVAVILALLLTNRVAAVVALAGVPVVTALVAGFGPTEIGEFVAGGLGGVVGVVAMFVFAIVYFGIMRDAGMFDPIIRRIVAFAGNAPVTVCLATATLAMAAHLDGAGATTFLITIPAMLPLFDRLGMSRLVLATCVGLGAGVMNIVPWGGPTARAAATSGVPANELWVPLIPAQLAGIVAVLAIAWFLGRRETRRLASATAASDGSDTATSVDEPGQAYAALSPEDQELRRPRLFWVNVALTVAAIAALVTAVATPELVFLVAVVIALLINYPGLKNQTDRIEAHAKGAMLMATTLIAAGVFLGILEGSGMIEAMAKTAAGALPDGAAPILPVLIAILAVPLSLVFGPDPYYFGVLPVLISVGEMHGIAAADIAQASILGEETVGFPISPLTGSFYLLVGLAGVDIGKHIRHLIGWAWLVSVVMLAVALVTGVIPVWAS